MSSLQPAEATYVGYSIYVGDADSVIRCIRNNRIGLVIALTVEDTPCRYRESDTLKIIHYPIEDSETADLRSAIDTLLPIMHSVINSHNGVLIHSAAGLSRAPALAIAYYLKYVYTDTDKDSYTYFISDGKGPLKLATERVSSERPRMNINRGFQKQLRDLEASILSDIGLTFIQDFANSS